VLSFAVLWLFTRSWPWLGVVRRRIDTGWIGHTIKAAGLVYLSDLGLVVYSYFDRFFIAGQLGLAATGVYTFYWTMANALLVLITAAVVQVSLPSLVDSFRIAEDTWRQTFGKMLVKALAGSLIMAIIMYGAVAILLPFIGNAELSRHPLVFPLMLVAIVVKIAADMTHYGLYSRKKDRTLAVINISGVGINLVLTFALVTLFGLVGVAVSMLGTAVYLLASRGYFLHLDVRQAQPGSVTTTLLG
jgi:O-antigen/teichoic acid export membrane protein